MRHILCTSLGVALLGVQLCSSPALADVWVKMNEHPLITWALEIGGAKSLPWGDPRSWNATVAGYDIERLAEDTLALLTPEMPVIMRMETMRRATVYSQKDPRGAYRLLAGLTARVRLAEEAGRPDVIAWFDQGYLIETFKRADWLKQDLFEDLNGYALIRKALHVGGSTPELQFGAALAVLEPSGKTPPLRHLQSAVYEATEGSLLEKNLLMLFGHQGKTLAALRANRYLRR